MAWTTPPYPDDIRTEINDIVERIDWLDEYVAGLRNASARRRLEAVLDATIVQAVTASGAWQWLRNARNADGLGALEPFARFAGHVPPPLETGTRGLSKNGQTLSMASTLWTAISRMKRNLCVPAFMLPVELGVEIMAVDLVSQDDLSELRLPFSTQNIWFDEPMRIPAKAFDPHDAMGAAILQRRTAFSEVAGTNATIGGIPLKKLQEELVAALTPEVVTGFSLFRDRDGGISPYVSLMTDMAVSVEDVNDAMQVIYTFDIDLRRGSVLAPAILNVVAALSFEYWRRPNMAAQEVDEGVSLTPIGPREAANDHPAALAFYVLDTSAPSPAPQSIGREMPEYTRREHYRPYRVGNRKNWPGTYVIRRVEEQQINENRGRPRSDPARYYELPTPHGKNWRGFVDGDVVVRDARQPSGWRLWTPDSGQPAAPETPAL